MKANQKFVGMKADDNAMIFELLIGAVFALIIGYTSLNIGIYITGTVGNSLVGTMPSAPTSRTSLQNSTYNMLVNTSADLTSNAKMISIAYVITIITLPLIAVVTIKKLM